MSTSAMGVWNILFIARDKHTVTQTKQTTKYKLSVETISSTQKGVIRGDFLANHLASTDNYIKTMNYVENRK